MKQISEDILKLTEGDVLIKRNTFISIAETLGISSKQYGDETFAEILQDLNQAIEIIKKASEKGIIDSLSFSLRENLKASLNSIITDATNLFINTPTGEVSVLADSLVNSIANLLNFIEQYSIDIYLKNLPDYKQKLNEIKQLNKKLGKLNENYNEAFNFLNKSVELFKILTDKNAESDVAQANIINISTKVSDILLKIEQSKADIEKKINYIQTFYTDKFEELNNKILDGENGLEATLKFVAVKRQEVEEIADNATNSLNSLNDSVNEYGKVLKTFNSLYNAVQELFDTVNDSESGIDKKFTIISETKTRIDELYTKSQVSFKIISDLEVKIDRIFNEAKEKLATISKAEENSKSTFEEIKRIYGIAADTGMGGEFNKRSTEFKNDFIDWGQKIIIATIVLFTAILILFILPYFCKDKSFCDVKLTPDFLLRITITSPLIFYLVFCTTQYTKAKDAYYKYCFKSTLAISIRNHINLLSDNSLFNDKAYTQQILDFAVRGLDRIYEEPYFDKNMEHKFRIKEDEIKFGFQKDNKTDSAPPKSS